MAKCTVHRPHVTVTLHVNEDEARFLLLTLQRAKGEILRPVLDALEGALNG